MPGQNEDQRITRAVQSHLRRRTWDQAEKYVQAVLLDPSVQAIHEESETEELRLGEELLARFQPLQNRYAAAVLDGDLDVLSRTCAGKHGRWGRICILTEGHETAGPHWGTTPDGRPIAWLGSAPDEI